MHKTLILYASTDGHTHKICQRLKQHIESEGQLASLCPIGDINSGELKHFNKLVIGASIRYGKHSQEVYQFIQQHAQWLDSLPNAFFSVNMVARKPDKNSPATNPYLKKFLKDISWRPKNLAVFAGKIDYQQYGVFDRFMIRLIMRLTKGPTAPDTNVEFTNWQDVDNFAKVLASMPPYQGKASDQ